MKAKTYKLYAAFAPSGRMMEGTVDRTVKGAKFSVLALLGDSPFPEIQDWKPYAEVGYTVRPVDVTERTKK